MPILALPRHATPRLAVPALPRHAAPCLAMPALRCVAARRHTSATRPFLRHVAKPHLPNGTSPNPIQPCVTRHAMPSRAVRSRAKRRPPHHSRRDEAPPSPPNPANVAERYQASRNHTCGSQPIPAEPPLPAMPRVALPHLATPAAAPGGALPNPPFQAGPCLAKPGPASPCPPFRASRFHAWPASPSLATDAERCRSQPGGGCPPSPTESDPTVRCEALPARPNREPASPCDARLS